MAGSSGNLLGRAGTSASLLNSTPRNSYQFRALSRKTVAFQKRQWATNIVCVGLCPLLMVAICGIMSFALGMLVYQTQENYFKQYCSEQNATNFETGNTEFTLFVQPFTTFVDQDGVEQKRYFYNTHPLGECMKWLSHDYPNSYPYAYGPSEASCPPSANPDVCPLVTTSTRPDPLYGWLPEADNDTYVSLATLASLLSSQRNVWGWVAQKDGVNIGTKPSEAGVNMFLPSPPLQNSGSGFLGDIPVALYTPDNTHEYWNSEMKFYPRPYFTPVASGGDFEEVTEKLLKTTYDLMDKITDLVYDYHNPKVYIQAAQALLRQVPYGAVLFEKMDATVAKFTLQIGTIRRLAYISESANVTGALLQSTDLPYASFPAEGERKLLFLSLLDKTILKRAHPLLENATITHGLRMMPVNESTIVTYPVGSYLGSVLYPFGLSFLLPVFVVTLVKEKEDRILVMMTMNGMKQHVYWITELFHFYALHAFSVIVFIITGLICQLEFFYNTDPGAYILFFIIWGFTQVGMAFLLSAFFSRSRVALLAVFCLVLAGVIINVAMNYVFEVRPSLGYLVYPPFAFYRALALMNERSYELSIPDFTMAMMVPGEEIYDCLIALVIDTVVVFILSSYFILVMPSEFGIQRPWHFIFTDPVKFVSRRMHRKQRLPEENPQAEAIDMPQEGDEVDDDADEDVKEEADRVMSDRYPKDAAVIIKNLKKRYPNGKLAVKGVSLAIDPNTVFGLLGPNGAGKTSLISILTGLYPPTTGDATVAGYNVYRDIDMIYQKIGVCPQHDILWDDLSVEEHLYFYARVKGITPAEEDAAVTEALEMVSLTKFRHRISKGLSGGEKRRLSIAIALIGFGKVIFLDEPTTGLDPEVRRLIWEIINKAKQGRTIVLTTHSMEEAEVLCQRIGIMSKGSLRCLGPQVRLKNRYGSGFKVSVSCDAADNKRVSEYLESILPAGAVKVDDFAGTISYEFEAAEISSLFQMIGENKDKHGIKFWGISQTTLEEVFLRIIKETDAEAS